MNGVVLALDLGARGYTDAQVYTGFFALFILVLAFLALYYRIKGSGMEDWQVAHRRAVTNSEDEATAEHTHLHYDGDRDTWRRELHSLFGERGGQVTTAREALSVLRGAAAARLTAFSPLPVRLAAEGLLYFALGSLLFVSRETWASFLSADLSVGLESVADLWSAVVAATLSSPVFEVVYAFILVTVIQLVEVLYYEYAIVSLFLVAGAALLFGVSRLHDERVGVSMDHLGVRRRSVLRVVGGGAALVWAASVIPVALLPTGGVAVASLLTVAVVIFLAGYITRLAIGRGITLVRQLRQQADDEESDDGAGSTPFAAVYVLSQWFWSVVGALALPFLGAYIIQIVTSGRVVEVYGAATGAGPVVQVGVVFTAALVSVVGLYQVAAVALAARRELSRVAARWAVKSRMAYDAFPVVVLVATLLVTARFLDPFAAVVASVLVAAVVRILLVAFRRAKLKLVLYERTDSPPARVVVKGYTVEDGAGREYPVLDVNGKKRLMGPENDVDALVDTALDVLEVYFASGDIPMTVEEYHYDRAVQFGLPGYDESVEAADNECAEAILSSLLFNGGVMDRSTLDKLKASLPADRFEKKLSELESADKLRYARGKVVLTDESYFARDGVIDRAIQRVF